MTKVRDEEMSYVGCTRAILVLSTLTCSNFKLDTITTKLSLTINLVYGRIGDMIIDHV
jgi:hypothetical protein